RVIEHLHLRTAPIHGIIVGVLAHAVEDAAVAFRGDVPLERELEVLELFGGDDVGGWSHARERALPNSPSRRDGIHLPSPPTDRAVAVEQQAPTRGTLFRGQDVEP